MEFRCTQQDEVSSINIAPSMQYGLPHDLQNMTSAEMDKVMSSLKNNNIV